MLLDETRGDDDGGDDRLAEYVEMRTGERVNKSTLAGTRRKLRQRLEVLRYVRDRVPEGDPDTPGDAAVLAHIKTKYGIAAEDIPTLRGLAGLARACPSPKSFHWARLARWSSRMTKPLALL